ncbi:MAG: hypothetical protein RQ723_06995 [Desulfuromonadales bacterium]|nr:hypothetical protein [Desulfuromonadales bacterium]
MDLIIQLVCPECHNPTPSRIADLAPGQRQSCDRCQTPARVTHASLEQLRRDLHDYCQH